MILRLSRITQVAIFESEEALTAAVQSAPTSVRDWYPGPQSGRFDADASSIHYQGTVLGDTIALISIYPTNNNFSRSAVQDALSKSSNLEDFIDRLTG